MTHPRLTASPFEMRFVANLARTRMAYLARRVSAVADAVEDVMLTSSDRPARATSLIVAGHRSGWVGCSIVVSYMEESSGSPRSCEPASRDQLLFDLATDCVWPSLRLRPGLDSTSWGTSTTIEVPTPPSAVLRRLRERHDRRERLPRLERIRAWVARGRRHDVGGVLLAMVDREIAGASGATDVAPDAPGDGGSWPTP